MSHHSSGQTDEASTLAPCMAWNPDQTYPITLGDSILGLEAPEHWTLRYDFKPASAAESGQGRLSVDHATQRVSRHESSICS